MKHSKLNATQDNKKASASKLKDQQVFYSQSRSVTQPKLSLPDILSQPLQKQQQQHQQQQDSKKETKLEDMSSELLIGGTPIVPHSCCYILKPDNW